MINLLPPEFKRDVIYARYNRELLKYVKLTVALFVVLAGSLLGARYYLDQQIALADKEVKSKQEQIATYKGLQADATALNDRLTAIKGIQKSQSKFSVLLSDLARYMPDGTAISSLTLSGSDAQPVQLTVTAVDYKTALGFRDSIARSARISAADIQSITPNPDTTSPAKYSVVVLFAFNPGDAK